MKLSHARKEAFLEACGEIIRRTFSNYQNDYRANQFPGEISDLTFSNHFTLAPASFPNLLHDKLDALIAIYNKAESAKFDEEVNIVKQIEALGFLMQHGAATDHDLNLFFHEFSDVLSVEERIQIRSDTAAQNIITILQNENELEHALQCTEWFSDSFKAYAKQVSYVQAFNHRKLDENDITEDFKTIIICLRKSFPNEHHLLETFTWNESLKLYSVMSYLEKKYVEQDPKVDPRITEEDDGAQLKYVSSGQKLILGRDLKPSVLSGHLSEIIPYLYPKIAKPLMDNSNHKDKDERSAPVINVAAQNPVYRQFGYYNRHHRFMPNIDDSITTFKADFVTRRHRFQGLEKLGFEEEMVFDTSVISDDEIINKVHDLLGGERKLSRKRAYEFLCAYEQSTWQEVFADLTKSLLPEGQFFMQPDNDVNSPDASFTAEVTEAGEIYLNYTSGLTSYILKRPGEILASIPAVVELRFKMANQNDQLGFELVESWSTNRDFIEMFNGKKIAADKLIRKSKHEAEVEIEVAMTQAVKLKNYADHEAALIDAIRQLDPKSALRKPAQDVLNLVRKQAQKRLPKINDQELILVLSQTVTLLKTEPTSLLFHSVATNYETTARSFQSRAKKLAIAGAMLALLSVAIIVGCAMLMASTFGAGAVIGIPVLVGAAVVPHFTAGMSLGVLLGTGLGLFGHKAISRAATDYKLGKAMNELSEIKKPKV